MKNAKGLCFEQSSLTKELQSLRAGQKRSTQLFVICLALIACFVASFMGGYVGSFTGLEIGAKLGGEKLYIFNSIVLWAWISVGVVSFRKSIFALLITLILIISYQIASNSIVYAFGIPIMFLYTSISTVSFCFFCFFLAMTKTLISKSRFLVLVGLFMILLGTLTSGWFVVFFGVSSGSEYEKKLLSASYLRSTIFIVSFTYSFSFFALAWLANKIRKIPLAPVSPLSVFLSSLAVAIGSWRGTSFYGLDLTYVNFMGAKLANTDLRAYKLYRTCFQGVTGLDRARVDNRYLDLDIPKVQKLLIHGCSVEQDFSRLNLRGAYLQNANLQQVNFTDTELTGADLTDTSLQGALFFRSDVTGVDFSRANLTGICIQDWNINNQTLFTNVQCDYVYRKLDENGQPIDRFPIDRNFEPREFESLYQEVGNVVELIFKEGFNWQAVAFTLQKLQLEDEGLGLELRGIEKRGDLWVVKVSHNESVSGAAVERRLYPQLEKMQKLLATKEQQINKLLGIASDQAEALKEFSRKSFGNSFFIAGSTITNLTGQGQIEYAEAANQVRSIIASATNPGQVTTAAQTLISQLQSQEVAVTLRAQTDFIQQILLTEAQKDPVFQQFLLQQGQQIIDVMPNSAIATALRSAIAQLNGEGSSGIV